MNLENELKTVLRDDAPSPSQREEWVRAALDGAPARPTRSPWRSVGWLAAAAAAAILLALNLPREEPPAPPALPSDAPSTVDAERVANLAALKAVDDKVWKTWKGKFAVVAGGIVRAEAKLDDALAWAEKHHPKAQHRFVFRIGDYVPGDVIGDRSPVRELIVGLGFLQDLGIELEGAPGEWEVHRGNRVVKVAAQKATLDLVIEGRTLRLAIEPESLCPIMLPENAAYSRWEVPGTAIYEGLDRKWRSYRRYSVRVRNEALGIDGLFEACGAKYDGAIAPGNFIAVRLGTHVFHALRGDPAVVAQREGRPLIVLHLRDEDTERIHALFERVEFEGHSQFLVPGAAKSELRRYTKEGKEMGRLALPAEPAAVRKFMTVR